MRIICIQDELSRYLQIAVKAIAAKTTLPILTGIYLEAKDGNLRCLATDLEVAVEVNVPNVQIITPGSVVVSGKTFVDIIRHLPPVPVEIEYDDSSKSVSVVSKNSIYQMPVLPEEEFPTLPEIKSGNTVKVKGNELKEAIQQTIFATLADDPRPFLSSILWEISPDKLRLVATDVNRLAIRDVNAKSDGQSSVLIPVRALREIANIFGGIHDADVEVILNEKLIYITGGGVKFSSRLVEAQFPRYETVIPKDFSGSIIADRNDLIDALERTALVSNSIRIGLLGPEMVINAKEPDKGNCKEVVNVDFEGKEIEIGFNVRFLLDFLKTAHEEKIVFKYVQEQKPAIIQGQNNDNYLYVVMPLKLSV